MLTPAQIIARDGKLTASRVSALMTGDEAQLLNLWREMVGDPSFMPDDLSGVWAVQLGSATEQLNLDWFARKRGAVSRRGEVVIGATDWMAATLDGWSEQHGCPIEAKHCGGRESLDTIIDRYQPQMQWQAMVTKAEQCALSVIMGTNEPIVEFVPRDADYGAEMLRRASAFMECVWTMRPPIAERPRAAPVVPVKTYDMAGNNEWASFAADWLANKDARKIAETAEKDLKALVPEDGIHCHGYGVAIKRARNGNLSLRETKNGQAGEGAEERNSERAIRATAG